MTTQKPGTTTVRDLLAELIKTQNKQGLIDLCNTLTPKDRRMTLAYDGLLWRIDAGWEYPDAHTTVCKDFDLSVEDGEELTRRYDKAESQQP